ncbi:hypothetical protein [Halofilum ochraceum]|uniref:hypothetical protein n=1 Tax=Halofilum ochraceum TaxID=1611323 RepID=UPI0008DAD6AC|nr:hypothetical protein [Halofilum ochraceum]
MSGKSIEDLDPEALENMDPTEIAVAMEGDSESDGAPAQRQKRDPRGDPSNAEEDRERGSTRPDYEAERATSGKRDGDTGDKGDGDTSTGSEAGSEDSPDSDEGKPVETADGKHTIPHGVLKGEREEKARLKAELERREQELEQLRQNNPGETTATSEGGQGQDGQGDNAGTRTDPNAYDWNQIAEEYGDEYAQMMRERVEREQELERRLQQQEERERAREKDAERQTQETVQGAIDNLPTLATWQSQDPAMFEAAKAVDNQLMQDPQWQGASYADRFTEVVRRLRPDAPEVSGQSNANNRGNSGKQEDDDTPPPPTSHSDAPGGSSPDARSERERIEDADPTDLESRFDRMTDAQKEEFLAGL